MSLLLANSGSSAVPFENDGDKHESAAGGRAMVCGGRLSLASLLCGSLFFSGTVFYMLVEGLTVIDAMYLACGVITTVRVGMRVERGYGMG